MPDPLSELQNNRTRILEVLLEEKKRWEEQVSRAIENCSNPSASQGLKQARQELERITKEVMDLIK